MYKHAGMGNSCFLPSHRRLMTFTTFVKTEIKCNDDLERIGLTIYEFVRNDVNRRSAIL